MKLNLRRSLGIAGSSVLTTLLLVPVAFAATPSINGGVQQDVSANINSGNLVQTIFKVVEFAAIVLFVILLLIGGIQYLGSFGNEEATTKARKLILDAVVGLFIVLAAGAIAGIVFAQLGVQSGFTGL